MKRVRGTFDNDGWDEHPYDERDGAKLARVHVTRTFHGDLEGATSTTDIFTAQAAAEESYAYLGLERFTGAVDGRAGTFVLCHYATSLNGENSLSWRILPGSGTGDLVGIRGEGQIEIGPDGTHSFYLDYELG